MCSGASDARSEASPGGGIQGEEQEHVLVCASGPESRNGLRCRFGNQEVPGLQDEQGSISCLPPAPEGDRQVPLEVFDGDQSIYKDMYDYENKNLINRKTGQSHLGGPDGDAKLGLGEKVEADKQGMARAKQRLERSGLLPFVIISSSYLLFTITDGAIRMIILLHAYTSGFTAWEVAIMFTAYEIAGVFTNLLAGIAGAKWGIKTTLMSGLCLQICGISLLFAWQDEWNEVGNKWKAILFVTFAQMPCGIAKDLTKLGGKTVTKLITPDEKQTRLFKLVSLITGWKNSLKGVGYFLGSAVVTVSYNGALGMLIGIILMAMPWAFFGLSDQLGRTRKENLTMRKIFKQSYNINVLSISRFFLFGSRDMWFEVPLPFFLRDASGLGWSRPITGLTLAVFIIIYGQVQSWTPFLFLGPLKQTPANKFVGVLWNFLLIFCPLYLACALQWTPSFDEPQDQGAMVAIIMSGLSWFCVIFAINSSVHSYLIVRYAEGDKAAINVGFYYMANAIGRLVGTLVSGALYEFSSDDQAKAFAACFWASVAFAAASCLVEMFIKDDVGGLYCGCFPIIKPPPVLEVEKEDGDPRVAITMGE